MTPITRNRVLKPLKNFATAVGAKIRIQYTNLGEGQYELLDKDGERLVLEYDAYDMLDSISAYYGSHPRYEEALAQFNYMTNRETV